MTAQHVMVLRSSLEKEHTSIPGRGLVVVPEFNRKDAQLHTSISVLSLQCKHYCRAKLFRRRLLRFLPSHAVPSQALLTSLYNIVGDLLAWNMESLLVNQLAIEGTVMLVIPTPSEDRLSTLCSSYPAGTREMRYYG